MIETEKIKYAQAVLQDFINCKMSINIKGATAEDMRNLQSVVGRRWKSGQDLFDLRYTNYLKYNSYIHNNVMWHPTDSLSRCSEPYGETQMTIKEFLALFDICIVESEIEGMFEE